MSAPTTLPELPTDSLRMRSQPKAPQPTSRACRADPFSKPPEQPSTGRLPHVGIQLQALQL